MFVYREKGRGSFGLLIVDSPEDTMNSPNQWGKRDGCHCVVTAMNDPARTRRLSVDFREGDRIECEHQFIVG
jgi:hypothetical protein